MKHLDTHIFSKVVLGMLVLLAGVRLSHAQLTVSLETSLPSGQPAGTEVLLAASVANSGNGQLAYQFTVRPVGGAWRVLRDLSYLPVVEWVTLDEGSYELRVIAVLTAIGEIAEAVVPFEITPRVGVFPAVVATSHPLVALYSAPPCAMGNLWVRFRPVGGLLWQTTPAKPCQGKSLNFYVAGMRGNTTYQLQQEHLVGSRIMRGSLLNFRTNVPTVAFEDISITDPPDANTSLTNDVVLLAYVRGVERPVATDLMGNIIWYYPSGGATLLRPLPGGTMLLQVRDIYDGQILREVDLGGNIVRETNAFRVSTQLQAMGKNPINSFHHDAIRLPNGHTVVIGSVERILTDVQGLGDVNVYGEMIMDLDENFQVTWVWNAFDHLDTSRLAILGEVCTSQGPGCPPLFLAPTANDWLHANSLDYVPTDGSLLMSMRHQDWVIKIDFQHGTGSGNVIWRLGQDGDFQIISADPWPWFSHQHDAEIESDGRLVLYDNGNTRVEGPNGIGGNSRGQVLRLNETARTATLVHNSDLGDYSFALGSAQRLANGNYAFTSGFLGERSNPSCESIEVLPNGQKNFVLHSTGAMYRSFRIRDLYRP